MASIEQQYPELFVGLTETERRLVRNSIAIVALEGWNPTREDVQLQVQLVSGDLTSDEVRAKHHDRAYAAQQRSKLNP